jgi:hypothetical protein
VLTVILQELLLEEQISEEQKDKCLPHAAKFVFGHALFIHKMGNNGIRIFPFARKKFDNLVNLVGFKDRAQQNFFPRANLAVGFDFFFDLLNNSIDLLYLIRCEFCHLVKVMK